MSAVRLHQVLLAAACLVPAALFAGAAVQNRKDVLRAGYDGMARTTAIMHEHAQKVFETQDLALALVQERLLDLDSAAVDGPATSDFLNRLKASLEQVVSIWIADENGMIRAGSQPWELGTGIAGRDFFQAQRDRDVGLYLSRPFVGRATATASFALSRRLEAQGGRFAGTVHVAASPEYFQRFYAEAAPPYAHVALLIRSDGHALARDPPGPLLFQAPADSPLRTAFATQPSGGQLRAPSSVDGVNRLWIYQKVGAYPVYVIFGVDERVLLQPWRENLWVFGAGSLVAALTLLVVSWLALSRAQAEQAALARLQRETGQRQAVEQQLRHVQRLEAVGQLTGGIAHDFNNLMTAILGNLELIQRAAAAGPGPSSDKITRLAGTAVSAVQRGSKLTKSLLAFSRTQPLQTEAVDINALLTEFSELVRQAVGARIAVELQLDPHLPRAWADTAQLEAAVLNLAINARDAMQGGGTLRIGTGTRAMTDDDLAGNPEAQPGRFVRITVEDTGSGMDPEVAAKAFEPFFTTKPVGQGTGLGLSQVFGFARQLGGHVAIRSAPGAGCAISLYLPQA